MKLDIFANVLDSDLTEKQIEKASLVFSKREETNEFDKMTIAEAIERDKQLQRDREN